jgi:CheY-like chemotaxis protein
LNQIVAGTMLEKSGYAIHSVSNGLEALKEIEARPYDLILMDCQMPELDGYETSRRIRQHERETIRNIPIVAMTANAVTGDREKCLAAGMDDYVPKPVDPDRLAYIVDKWTRGPIDGTVLERLRSFESPKRPGVLKRVIEVFFSSTAVRFERMEKALSERNAAALAREAHNLKNSTAQVGAFRMTPICLQLEEIEHRPPARLNEAPYLLAQLKREYSLVRLALEKQIGDHKQVA